MEPIITFVGEPRHDCFLIPPDYDILNESIKYLPIGPLLLRNLLKHVVNLAGVADAEHQPLNLESIIRLEKSKESDENLKKYKVKGCDFVPIRLQPNNNIENFVSIQQNGRESIRVTEGLDELANSIYRITSGKGNLPNRRAIVVDAEYIRMKGVRISRHLSWCQTIEDVEAFLSQIRNFNEFYKFEHIIIRFDCDGTIHCRRNNNNNNGNGNGNNITYELTLYFAKSEEAEGDYNRTYHGHTPSITAAFMTGFLFNIVNLDPNNVSRGIHIGMRFARQMAREGLQMRKRGPNDGFGALYHPELNREDEEGIETVPIPAMRGNATWSILEFVFNIARNADNKLNYPTNIRQLANNIVRKGPEHSLFRVPTVQYGKLITAERGEMEGFRAIANLVEEYIQAPRTKPISIGAFGQPGSGKSFGLKQMLKAVFTHKGKEPKLLEFNLSQFRQYSDLIHAFHTIRDEALTGRPPIVLFDEFDSTFNEKDLGWLQYFLAPMQDGNFLESGCYRPLGSAIFIFIGGTSVTFEKFSGYPSPPDRSARAAKKPDFVSRLRGYVNIKGINQNNDDENHYIRRAIVLHSQLQGRLLRKAGEFDVDEAVLKRLFDIPEFIHGARSLEAILDMSRLHGRNKFVLSALPSVHQLSMHISRESANTLLGYPLDPPNLPNQIQNIQADILRQLQGPPLQQLLEQLAALQVLQGNIPQQVQGQPLQQHLQELQRLQNLRIPQG